ncbi:unnamed protein product, partial [Lactuca virosa]
HVDGVYANPDILAIYLSVLGCLLLYLSSCRFQDLLSSRRRTAILICCSLYWSFNRIGFSNLKKVEDVRPLGLVSSFGTHVHVHEFGVR